MYYFLPWEILSWISDQKDPYVFASKVGSLEVQGSANVPLNG